MPIKYFAFSANSCLKKFFNVKFMAMVQRGMCDFHRSKVNLKILDRVNRSVIF